MSPIRRLPPLFWIGLLPVVILLGLWADGLRYSSGGSYCRDPENCWAFSCRDSGIYLEHMVLEKREPGKIEGTKLIETTESGDWVRLPYVCTEIFPMPEAMLSSPLKIDGNGGPDLEIHFLLLPFWLLLLGYLPLWLPLAWWQARRRRRRIEAMGPQAGDLGERHEEPRMGTD